MTEVVRPDRSAAAARAVAHAGPSPWQQLAQLQQRALAANRVAELAFIAVNETWQLMPYRQAVLWRFDARDRPALQAVSGLARLAEESPNTIWLKRLGRWLARRVGADRPEGGEAGATSAAGVGAGVGHGRRHAGSSAGRRKRHVVKQADNGPRLAEPVDLHGLALRHGLQHPLARGCL